MPVIIDSSGTVYRPYTYQKEEDFESAVIALADQIFGALSIYVNVKKRMTGNDIVSIPDGYLIDMTDPDLPQLFVIENEIVKHDVFRHIGVQMLRFATSFDEAQLAIRNFLMEEISKDRDKITRLEDGCKRSRSRNIDNYLDSAVYGDFRALVVIDEARNELHHVLEKINANISVLELKTYVSEDGSRLHLFDTLYEEYEEFAQDVKATQPGVQSAPTSDDRQRRRARLAHCDTVIVPAREDGFQKVFLGEHQWFAIRIGAAMKDRIKFIAAYQVNPISAVTHIAEVQEIRLYKDTGKYALNFKGPAQEIGPIKIRESKNSPQGPVYVRKDDLLNAASLEDALRSD
jgi:hypothetical protein